MFETQVLSPRHFFLVFFSITIDKFSTKTICRYQLIHNYLNDIFSFRANLSPVKGGSGLLCHDDQQWDNFGMRSYIAIRLGGVLYWTRLICPWLISHRMNCMITFLCTGIIIFAILAQALTSIHHLLLNI